MARQVSFDDIIPSEFKQQVVGFVGQRFHVAQEECTLPAIKNGHEAYGVMAEAYVLLKGAAASVKSAMDDALSALPASGQAFDEAVDMVYSGCVSTAQAAIHMAVQAQNISMRRIEMRRDQPLPLLDGMEDDMEQLPDFNPEQPEADDPDIIDYDDEDEEDNEDGE